MVGITQHLDDANLQQFVNSKTQRPLYFSYQAKSVEGKEIGVIHVPPQERPLHLKKDYGGVNKDVVYVRRGSSTAIASPDEIAKMRSSSGPSPEELLILQVQFYDTKEVSSLGPEFCANTVNLELLQDHAIPDYGVVRRPSGFDFSPSFAGTNADYYRQYAKYLQTVMRYKRVDFNVTNSGHCVALDVRLQAEISDPGGTILLADETKMPEEPSRDRFTIPRVKPLVGPDITVQEAPGRWILRAVVGKIQPQSAVHTTSGLYVGAKDGQEIVLPISIYADNLPDPKRQDLVLRITPRHEQPDADALLRMLSDSAFDDETETE